MIRFSLRLIIALCFSVQAIAQTSYTLIYSNQSYSSLVNPVLIAGNADFNGSYYTLNLGFAFNYFGQSYSVISFNTDGYCIMGTLANYGFYTMYANLNGRGHSQINYQLDGAVGNRIMKIEWQNVGFVNDPTNNDSATFQIWLYESTNQVEYHFGQWSIDPSHYMALFSSPNGVFEAFNDPSGNPYYNVWGNPSMPSFAHNPSALMYMNGYPNYGLVYTFSPDVQAGIIQNYEPDRIILFPVPVSDILYLNNADILRASSYSIMDDTGSVIKEMNALPGNDLGIDVRGLEPGLYVLQINTGNKIISKQKFIHQ
jgi:hypothetical protein